MREVVTRSGMAIFVMRYLLLPIMILATTHSLYSQTGVYVVAPLDLSRGYAIAEGGTITVAGGNITEWDISVTDTRATWAPNVTTMASIRIRPDE